MESRWDGLESDQRRLAEQAHALVDGVVTPYVEASREAEWNAPPSRRVPWELLRAVDEAGLRTLGLPTLAGGQGAVSVLAHVVVAEELARGESSLIDILLQGWKVGTIVAAHGEPTVAERHLSRFAADPMFLFSHCSTEPHGSSDRWLGRDVPDAAMSTVAEERHGNWVIDGQAVHHQRPGRLALRRVRNHDRGGPALAGHEQLHRHPRRPRLPSGRCARDGGRAALQQRRVGPDGLHCPRRTSPRPRHRRRDVGPGFSRQQGHHRRPGCGRGPSRFRGGRRIHPSPGTGGRAYPPAPGCSHTSGRHGYPGGVGAGVGAPRRPRHRLRSTTPTPPHLYGKGAGDRNRFRGGPAGGGDSWRSGCDARGRCGAAAARRHALPSSRRHQ